jgi:hypothetical protein
MLAYAATLSAMARRRRSVRSYVVEIAFVLVALAVMLGIVLPWAGGELTESAQERFLPTASPSISVQQ